MPLGGPLTSCRKALGCIERLQLGDQVGTIWGVVVCGGNPLADRHSQGRHVGVDCLLVPRVGHQRPEHDAQRHDQSAGILEKRPGRLPGPLEHDRRPRPAPAGEFHHERLWRAVERRPREHPGHNRSNHDSQGVQAGEDRGLQWQPGQPCGAVRNKGPAEQQVDRQPRGATHQRRDEDRQQAVAAVLDRAGRHDPGDRAGEARKQRNERLAAQSHAHE